jgi:hypothetical protein
MFSIFTSIDDLCLGASSGVDFCRKFDLIMLIVVVNCIWQSGAESEALTDPTFWRFDIWDPRLSSTTTSSTTPPTTITVTTRVRVICVSVGSKSEEFWLASKYNNTNTQYNNHWYSGHHNFTSFNNHSNNDNNTTHININKHWSIIDYQIFSFYFSISHLDYFLVLVGATANKTTAGPSVISAKDYEEACKQPVAIGTACVMTVMMVMKFIGMFTLFTKIDSLFNPSRLMADHRRHAFIKLHTSRS